MQCNHLHYTLQSMKPIRIFVVVVRGSIFLRRSYKLLVYTRH